MPRDIEIIPPDRFQPTPRIDVSSSAPANPVSRFMDRMRRKSVEERRGVVQELTRLMDDMRQLNGAYSDYQKSLISLKTLDQALESEELRVLAALDRQDRELLLQIRNDELRLMTEQLELELKYEAAQKRLDQFRNPPEKRVAADPMDDAIAAAMQGGGRYTTKVNAMREDLIRKRGGEQNLTEEDRERIQNAYQVAAEGDHSRGR